MAPTFFLRGLQRFEEDACNYHVPTDWHFCSKYDVLALAGFVFQLPGRAAALLKICGIKINSKGAQCKRHTRRNKTTATLSLSVPLATPHRFLAAVGVAPHETMRFAARCMNLECSQL